MLICGHYMCLGHVSSLNNVLKCNHNSLYSSGKVFHHILEASCRDVFLFIHKSKKDVGL